MKNNYFKLMVLSISVLFFISCSSQKATTADTNDAPQAERKKPRGQGNEKRKGERPTFAKLLAEMDSNKDGKLSKEEVRGPLKENFSKIDKNSDGFISEDEFKSAPAPRGPRQ